MEKATEQLSGRVTQSQKEYFVGLEGSFSDKVAQLIELHKNRVENDIFTISPSLDAINKAIGTIIKNVEVIESNANNYVDDYSNKISAKIAALEDDAIELRNISDEYAKLEKANEILLKEYEDLKSKFENMEKTIENKDFKIKELVEKNNELLNDKLNNQASMEKLRTDYKDQFDKLKMDYKDQLEKLEKELQLKDISINELDKKVSIEENKANTLKEKVEELKVEAKEVKDSHKMDVKELNDKIESLADQLGSEKLIKQKLEIELNNKLENKDNEITEKDSIIEKLTKELENLKNTSKVSKKITKGDE